MGTDKLFYAFGSDFSASIFSLYWLVLFSLCHQLSSFMFLLPKSVCTGGWVCVCLLSFRQGITTDLLRVCGYCLLPSSPSSLQVFFLFVFMQSFWAPSTHFAKSIFVLAINKPNRVCCGCVFPATQHSLSTVHSLCGCVSLFILQLAAKSMVDASRILALALMLVEKWGRGRRGAQQPRQSML